jgi:hypothetical protein
VILRQLFVAGKVLGDDWLAGSEFGYGFSPACSASSVRRTRSAQTRN